MKTIDDILNQGITLQRGGHYQEALEAYHTILNIDPAHPDALNLSGIIASRTGQQDEAVRLIKKALAHSPRNSGYLNSLGNALQAKGDLPAARQAYEKGLALAPDDIDLLYNLGRLHKSMGMVDRAAEYYRKALQVNPDDDWVWNGLGNLQKKLGRFEEAISSFRRAIALNPQFGKAYNNLANTYREQGLYDNALAQYQKALELEPGDPDIYVSRGAVLLEVGRLSPAVADFQAALRLDPGNRGAYRNLGNAYRAQGRVEEALVCYRDLLSRAPEDAVTHSNLVFCANNVPGYGQSQLGGLARDWGRRHAAVKTNDDFSNPPDPERRLRVGYVSPDFRQHSVSYFFKALLAAHNRDAVEVFCYADVKKPDGITQALQEMSDHWRNIVGFSDQTVFGRVVNDGIDILVDLAGHTSGNRLPVFARQPAPVQVTWLGYPNTTGVPAMHYRLTDAVADPPGDADRHHTEKLIRLPHGFLCYQSSEACPAIAPAPSLSCGRVTFGSFNNIAKINPEVIRVWARVLRAVPGAKLLLKSKQLADQSVRSRYRELFTRQGVAPDQLEMLSYALSWSEHMAVYNRVDVALDTFPYNGTTTTCEAMWMGVPVVTLCGERHAARVGASLLTHGGYPELIADSEHSFIEKAAGLAADKAGLNALRQGMRSRLRASYLCNTTGFAADLEQVYRGLWSEWCARSTGKSRPSTGLRTAAGTGTLPPNDTRQAYQHGLALLQAGDLDQAEKAFIAAIDRDPAHAEAHYNIGVLRQRAGRLAEAAKAYQTVVELDPENPAAYYNLGNCCQALHQPESALDNYRRALGLDPDFAPAHNNMGLLLKNTGRLAEAVRSFERAIELDPHTAGYHQNLGLTFHKQACYLKAIDCLQTALQLVPASPVARYNLAAAFEGAGNYEEAERQLARVVELDPDFGEAYHNRGDVLGKMGRFAAAAGCYRQAIRVKPDRSESWNGLGNALTNLGRTDEATDCYKRAIGLRPAYAGAHTNLGTAYYEDRQLSLAEKHYRRALELDAGLVEAEFNLGLVHLLRGDLEKGWPGYEKRFSKSDWAANYPYRFEKPKWDGGPFEGKRLLVHDEQGLGDTLQFVRYLELVKPLGGQVLLETRRPCLELLKDSLGVDRVIERSKDGQPTVDFDLYCPLLSLPGIFTTTLASIPTRVPYIRADTSKAALWGDRMEKRVPKIGLVWSGNPSHFRGLNRSASLAEFEGLLKTPGVRFYGFQKGPAGRDAARFADAGRIENLGEDFTDFSDTAAAMAHMDLVISIDTSVAHLAGAMGKPVWVLLAHAADWRWLMERDDSPWYPTMRLFRQPRKNDWAGVLDEVQRALDALLA